jgi:adenine-specific DNA-methyltransferase
MAKKKQTSKDVEHLKHEEASRTNIPTAEYQSMVSDEVEKPVEVAYERRNQDLDPQLVWRGKDQQDWSDLVVQAPPLYIQEKIHPHALIEDLKRRSKESEPNQPSQLDLFGEFNGDTQGAETDFYQYDKNWTNRMILGDSLQVMASLAEREGMRGKVQCIYLDPPYGIKFNSNFQWSTTTTNVTDGKTEHITREPEQVKAFRDTWRDGIHSYLTYLRDRLMVARDLLADSGSIFVQIGDENVHRVRALMDEVFGEDNFISQISFAKTSGYQTNFLTGICDYILWYSKIKNLTKYRQLYKDKNIGSSGASKYNRLMLRDGTIRPFTKEEKNGNQSLPIDARVLVDDNLTSQGNPLIDFKFRGKVFKGTYKTTQKGLQRLSFANRIYQSKSIIRYIRFANDFPKNPLNAAWMDIGGVQSRSDPKIFVVQTATEAIRRCVLMTTDPGDLVLDPTCGAGTTAQVAEQWGRRWITIDTSRVALALARSRIMGAQYPYYLLKDSKTGQQKEAELQGKVPPDSPTYGNINHGFVYERVPHITLKSIANNSEIDVIWDKYQETMEPLLEQLNEKLGTEWEEWQIPREVGKDWPKKAKEVHAQWWEQRQARQKEIDDSIARNADQEYLYDRPYEDKEKVRVAGPFTVESMMPHRTLGVDENDELIDGANGPGSSYEEKQDFTQKVLKNLRTQGVQQAYKEDRISFTSLNPWPGELICGEGRYKEGDGEIGQEKKAAIFIGPEFGTVSRADLVRAAREAADAGFDVLISCAFSYDAYSEEFKKIGKVPVLKATMSVDMHMADALKNTGQGNNLFVIFGEPDIDIQNARDNQVQVKVNGVEVFHPNTGELRSDSTDGIACWFIDTDYNEESFFVRHAYFLGAGNPYESLKKTLRSEINEEAWETLYSDTSRPFEKPKSGRIAVKVINHLGDEVMKVFKLEDHVPKEEG